MSRTTLCVLTAATLAAAAVGVMLTRHYVLGADVNLPVDAGTWKVTLVVTGKSAGDVRLLTATPLDFGHQHVLRDACRSEELIDRPTDARHPARRQTVWVQRPGATEGPFHARYEFYCTTSLAKPTPTMVELARTMAQAPRPGQYLHAEPGVDTDHAAITDLARRLTAGLRRPVDQIEALYQHVAGAIDNEPRVAGSSTSSVECLHNHSGDSRAKSRLLAALCRNCGFPTRLVTGLALARGREQTAHVWLEVWLQDHWLPMCPFYHYFGRVPRTYLVFGHGDVTLVRAHNVRNLEYRFLVERPASGDTVAGKPSLARRVLMACSFHLLPPAEQRLVEFLLLLPIAALIVCVFRNLIGIGSFGTFAPALLGLSFRELHSLPGILVFVSIVLVGWLMRRVLDRYHLLQVPRTAFLLSLVIIVLISCIVLAAERNVAATRYVSLFPIIILVGMIERFWTLESEDGTVSSFRTLVATVFISCTISLVLSLHAVVAHMYRYPETLGVIMAAQLLIGRYTGYRLTELYRFRDFVQPPPMPKPDAESIVTMRLLSADAWRSPSVKP